MVYEIQEVPGLYYIPNYLNKKEITSIETYLKTTGEENFEGISKKNSSRRVIQYGYIYSYDRSGVNETTPIPNLFLKLIKAEKINNILEKELIKDLSDQLIINEFLSGQGISHHTDHEKYFGSIILCISVGCKTNIEFINKETNCKKIINVDIGSLYIMSGDSRYKWTHGIIKDLKNSNKKEKPRYSLTYRNVTKLVKDKNKKDKNDNKIKTI